MVLLQLRLKVDDFFWFVHYKNVGFFNLQWSVLLGDIFSLHYFLFIPIISSDLIGIFLDMPSSIKVLSAGLYAEREDSF